MGNRPASSTPPKSPSSSSAAVNDSDDFLERLPVDAVDNISAFIDSCDNRKDSLATNEAVQSFLNRAAAAAPSLMVALGGIGEAAPLGGWLGWSLLY